MIPFTKPALTGNEEMYVVDAIRTGWISGVGPYVGRFEQALADQIGVKRVVACSNGTLALEVLLQALNIEPGDEVIVPAMTFVAPAAAAARLRANIVFADIHPETWTIDPKSVEKCLTKFTKAIIAVDLLGNSADFDTLNHMGVTVIEDAAQAHGATYKGRNCGSNGIAATFSFHANKAITTGEGGAILTDWDWLANACAKIMNHGMDYPYHHDVLGTNARPNNLMAAIGYAQIQQWDQHMAARRKVYDQYRQRLGHVVEFQKQVSSPWMAAIKHPFRDRILDQLRLSGVDSRAVFVPLCDLPIYRGALVLKDYPVAREIGREVLFLPTFEEITVEQIEYICDVVEKSLS